MIENGFRLVLDEDHDKKDPKTKPEVYNKKGRIVLHFDVRDVDACFTKIKDGPHIIFKPENKHWGTLWF